MIVDDRWITVSRRRVATKNDRRRDGGKLTPPATGDSGSERTRGALRMQQSRQKKDSLIAWVIGFAPLRDHLANTLMHLEKDRHVAVAEVQIDLLADRRFVHIKLGRHQQHRIVPPKIGCRLHRLE